MQTRDTILHQVRLAVTEGNRLQPAPPLPERGRIGYQGAADAVERFCSELTAAGGHPFVTPDRDAAVQRIRDIMQRHQARKIALGCGGVIEDLDVANRLRGDGVDMTPMDALAAPRFREAMFAADIGISNVAYLIAETGSVVMATAPNEPRSLSLLPPVHIALAHVEQILPDLFDLFDLYSPVADLAKPAAPPPSCLTLITGPSKTGDIELKLVTGVHGPGELHVILIGSQ
ncbi:MAG: lactate utilization protein [Gemmataceae bacterium]|nr:lactate utilization protein [Gemmataceae bacterium]